MLCSVLRKLSADSEPSIAELRSFFEAFSKFSFAFSGRPLFSEVNVHRTKAFYSAYQQNALRIDLASETTLTRLGSYHLSSLDCAHQP